MWEYRAQLIKAHDGDTFRVLVDTGFAQRAEVDLRLLNVRAPELHQPGGTECAAYVQKWMADAAAAQPGRRWALYVHTCPSKTAEPESRRTLNRYLAEVWRWDDRPTGPHPGRSLNEAIAGYIAGHSAWPSGR